jgi:hypothetical protein
MRNWKTGFAQLSACGTSALNNPAVLLAIAKLTKIAIDPYFSTLTGYHRDADRKRIITSLKNPKRVDRHVRLPA